MSIRLLRVLLAVIILIPLAFLLRDPLWLGGIILIFGLIPVFWPSTQKLVAALTALSAAAALALFASQNPALVVLAWPTLSVTMGLLIAQTVSALTLPREKKS